MCKILSTRQRGSLPRAKEEAHGKEKAHDKSDLCRVPETQHMAKLTFNVCQKSDTRQMCAPCTGLTVGRRPLGFAMCLTSKHGQVATLPCAGP